MGGRALAPEASQLPHQKLPRLICLGVLASCQEPTSPEWPELTKHQGRALGDLAVDWQAAPLDILNQRAHHSGQCRIRGLGRTAYPVVSSVFGRIFWFMWNKLVGSYLVLMATNRS